MNSRAHCTDPGSYLSQANHNQGWNIAFVDGHVKWLTIDGTNVAWNGWTGPGLANYHWTLAADLP